MRRGECGLLGTLAVEGLVECVDESGRAMVFIFDENGMSRKNSSDRRGRRGRWWASSRRRRRRADTFRADRVRRRTERRDRQYCIRRR